MNELHGFARRLVYEGLRRNDTAAGERRLLRPLVAALLTLPHATLLAAGFGGVRARTLGPVGTRSTQDALTAITEGCRVDVFALPRDQARPDATHATASSAR